MSDQTIRAEIKARLDALGTGMGRVHDYLRWATDPTTFLKQFQDPKTRKVFGWEIERTGFSTESATVIGRWKLIHRFVIRGYYALEDAAATEKTVNALADIIIYNLLRNRLSGTQKNQYPEGTITTRIFGNVLCHVVEIRLPEIVEIVSQLPEDGTTDLLLVGLNYYLVPGDDTADAEDVVTLSGPES